jgi:amidohydrolase
VFGTPAEEAIGGKAIMVNSGCFNDVDIAMMVHPMNSDFLQRYILSMVELTVTYEGKAAHAATSPWEGLNALDAAVMAYTGVSMLRQQMKPSWRVHGVFKKGGTKPNVIPEVAELNYYLRAPTDGELNILKTKMEAVFHSASQATGCEVKVTTQSHYSNLIVNTDLINVFEKNALPLGFKFKPPVWGGSTDMGNVSYVVPSIHPYFGVGTTAPCHTREFTLAANTDYAHERAICAGKALAMTAIDVLTCSPLLEKIKATFNEQSVVYRDST